MRKIGDLIEILEPHNDESLASIVGFTKDKRIRVEFGNGEQLVITEDDIYDNPHW
jgi:hypothetical protein